jgi:ABC-type bacteriocin/lantibiotic exporter with double-glycine peptidase domain
MLILITAFFDMMGVASVLPFIAVLSNPEIVETNIILAYLYQKSEILGVSNLTEFLFFLGIGVFILLIISLTFRALTTYGQMHFTLMQEFIIGRKLVEGYLNQPYSWFLNKNSSEIGKNILSDVKEIIDKTILSSLNVIVHGATITTLLTLLIIIDTKLALSVGLVLAITYGLIFILMKNFLIRIGAERVQVNSDRFKIILEAFSATKDVKVKGLENEYVNRFAKSAKIYAKNLSLAAVISQIPRYFIEAIAFGGMIILVLILMASGKSFVNILPIIALYAFAGYRLIPSLQIIYGSFILMRFMGPTLDSLIKDLVNLKKIEKNINEKNIILQFQKSIELKNIHFSYLNSEKEALSNINLKIPYKSKIGIVGSTGSGKTTMVDLILGLLDPSKGTIFVDEKLITNKNIRSWQKNIGYVPQNIFLSDCSVLENIALGINPKNIDKNAAETAAKIANLHNFIITDLPEGYDTKVGERGIRLSGGQRQRIGIARALYNKPQLLILDESTSALDNVTEKVVMESIHNLEKNITVIMIAHRLSTVKNCDSILVIDQGKLQAKGTYNQLTDTNDIFKNLSGLNS